jgi:hypothetical protein
LNVIGGHKAGLATLGLTLNEEPFFFGVEYVEDLVLFN